MQNVFTTLGDHNQTFGFFPLQNVFNSLGNGFHTWPLTGIKEKPLWPGQDDYSCKWFSKLWCNSPNTTCEFFWYYLRSGRFESTNLNDYHSSASQTNFLHSLCLLFQTMKGWIHACQCWNTLMYQLEVFKDILLGFLT